MLVNLTWLETQVILQLIKDNKKPSHKNPILDASSLRNLEHKLILLEKEIIKNGDSSPTNPTTNPTGGA